MYDLKGHIRHIFVLNYIWPEKSILCYVEVLLFFNLKTFWLNYISIQPWHTFLWTTFAIVSNALSQLSFNSGVLVALIDFLKKIAIKISTLSNRGFYSEK